MDDIKNNLENSFYFFKNNFKLFFPFFFSQASLYLFIILFIIFSGIGTIFYDIYTINSDYTSYTSQAILNNLEIQNKEIYFENNFNFDKYSYLFSSKIILTFLSSFLLYFIIASYLVNIGYYQNSQKLLFNKTLPFSTSIKKSSKFYWRFLFLRFLFLLAIFLPIIIIYAFSFFLLAKNNLVAGLILLLFSLLFIVVWITYISIRLFFIEAILYIDDANLSGVLKKSSSKNIIKKSLKVSKGKMRKIFIIAILIYGLSALINSFSGEPILDSFLEMIFNTNLATLPIFLSLFLLFIAINASLNCLMNIFLLKSYIEFKNGQNTSSVSNN